MNSRRCNNHRTHRYYNPLSGDVSYLEEEFSKSCRALGLKIKLFLCLSSKFTPQGEAIYERDKNGIVGYCMIEDYIPSQNGQLSEEYAEAPERGSKLLYIPRLFGDDSNITLDNMNEGALVEIVDDMNNERLEFGTYILEDIMLSPDRMYWECHAFIQRTEKDESAPDPGGAKENFSFLYKK